MVNKDGASYIGSQWREGPSYLGNQWGESLLTFVISGEGFPKISDKWRKAPYICGQCIRVP